MREKELEVQKKAEEMARKKAQENEQKKKVKKKRKIPIIMIMRQMVWTLIHLL